MRLLSEKMGKLSKRKIDFLVILAIIILTAVTYSGSLNNEFTNWDDDALIVNNESIKSLSLENIRKMFAYSFSGGTYQPVRVLSYALDYHFAGLDPTLYHIHSIFLHILGAVFLYLSFSMALPCIVDKKNESDAFSGEYHARWLAAIAALLFALHPVNVEAVTWLSSRKYVLMGTFSFISFYFYLKSTQKDTFNIWLNLVSIFFFFLAIFSSPFAVVLPAIFALFEYCRTSGNNIFQIISRKYKPFILYIIFGIAGFLMLWIRLTGSTGASTSHFKDQWFHTLVSVMQVIFDYLRNFLMPLWLNNRYVDYVYPSFFDSYKMTAGLIVLLCSVVLFVFFAWKNRKMIPFGIGWCFLAWLPASNIIPISTSMADRYLYLASPGFFLTAVVLIFNAVHALDKIKGLNKISSGQQTKITLALFSSILLVLIILSFQRNLVWRNSETMWRDSIKKDKSNFLAYNNLGAWLYTKGRMDEAVKNFEISFGYNPKGVMAIENLADTLAEQGELNKAVKMYGRLLELKPYDLMGNLKIGELYLEQDMPEKADKYFSSMLAQKKEHPAAFGLKGKALLSMGSYARALALLASGSKKYPDNDYICFVRGMTYFQLKKYEKALTYLKKAVKLKPLFYEAFNELGRIYEQLGDMELAADHYNKSIEVNSGFASAFNNLGNVLFHQKDLDGAKQKYLKALDINPTLANARFNLGVIYETQAKFEKAVENYKKTLSVDPEHEQASNNLGNIYVMTGEIKKAKQKYNESIAINKNYVSPYINLALVFEKENEFKAAAELYEKAVNIDPEEIVSLYKLVQIYQKMGQLNKAVDCYRQILNRKSNPAGDDYFNLGTLYVHKKKMKKAYQMFIKALEKEPDHIKAGKALKLFK